MLAGTTSGFEVLELPGADAEVLPGVRWGRFDELFTPAFWSGRAWLLTLDGGFPSNRLGQTLREEVAACLLGGYGIPAEMGLVAFHRVRDRGLLDGRTSANTLEASLREPFMVGGRNVRYRFAQQKAAYLAGAMRAVDELEQPADDVGFRDALAKLPGVGLKTASWITRNVRESDAVAILDIHVCRACALAGLFPQTANVATGYRKLERRYLAFAGAIGVKASVLDSLMWATMRRLSPWVRRFKPATSE